MNGTNGNEPGYPENALVPYPVIVVATTWLQVIKLYGCLHGFDEVLAANRKRSDSLSANKVSAVKGTWFLYTEIEGLSKPYAGYCLFWQMFHAVLKRIGKR